MNFEVHTAGGQVEVFEDFVEYSEAHRGLIVRAEHHHEFRMEAWGDLQISIHVRRVFRGLKFFENEARISVQTYPFDGSGRFSLISIRPDDALTTVETFDGAASLWLNQGDRPQRSRNRRGIEELAERARARRQE